MRILMLVFAVATSLSCQGRSEPPQVLWPEGKMPSVQTNQAFRPYLVWHAPDTLRSKAVLIAVSGGGYVSSDVEGFEVAPIRDYFLQKGVTVVTMRYRCPRPVGLRKHITAWQDAQRTVRLVRQEAIRRGFGPDKIGFTGCSAGGHLTMLAATSSRTPAYAPVDEIDQIPCNVNWAVPVYPAYLLTDGAERSNIRKGNDLTDALVPELAFDEDTPPMCFFHGDADGWSAMNSVRAYHKLRTMGLPTELHVMALEGHCFQSSPRPGTPAASWKDRVWEWLISIDAVMDHPQVWRTGWKPIFPLWSGPLEKQAEFAPGTWEKREWGGSCIVTAHGGALLLKESLMDFALDFEYKMTPGSAVTVTLNGERVTALTGTADVWHRMTLWRTGADVRIAVDGQMRTDSAVLKSKGPGRPCVESRTVGCEVRLRNVRLQTVK